MSDLISRQGADILDTNVRDTIYRQAAIDALGEKPLAWTEGEYELGMQNQWQSDIDALKELPSARPDTDEWCTDCKEYDQSQHCCPRWNRVIRKTLKDAQPEQRWIPCSERLPEGITQVIIQTNGEAIHEAFYMGKDDYGHYVWKRPDNEIYWDEEVVAWMPLPTPYQPKEDES